MSSANFLAEKPSFLDSIKPFLEMSISIQNNRIEIKFSFFSKEITLYQNKI
jgi:hypothetical protein